MSLIENLKPTMPRKDESLVDNIMSNLSLDETNTKRMDKKEIMHKILHSHIKKAKLHKKKNALRVPERTSDTKDSSTIPFTIPSPVKSKLNNPEKTVLISKSTISTIQANVIELHEKNRVQQQEIERLRELVKESHEREKFARDAALSQKTRMETIISSLQANIINMEHRMTKNSVENSKIAKEMTGNLELDLVRQKLVSKSLYEQVEILKTRQEFEKKKVTSLLKKQAAICIGVQETATNLDWENKKLKKYFEMLANSA